MTGRVRPRGGAKDEEEQEKKPNLRDVTRVTHRFSGGVLEKFEFSILA